jgi:hypothetical protein
VTAPVRTPWPAVPAPGSPEAKAARVRVALAELCDMTTAQSLAANPPPPTRYVVPGLLPHGLALLYGKPKQGKSWFALELALAVASGGLLAGHFPVERGDVLYLALEDGPSRLYERMVALLGDPDSAPAGLTFITRMRAGVGTAIKAWHAAVDDPRLVIVDTLQKTRAMPKSNGNAYAQDYAELTLIKDLADDLGICLLLVHHARKGHDDGDVDAASGTFGIVGAADTGLHLRQAVEGVSVLGSWSRDAEGGEWPMRRVGPSWQVTDGPIPDPNLGDRSTAVLAVVARRAEQGTKAADVAAALDVSEATARTYLSRLVDAGRISKRERGIFVPLSPPVASVMSVTSDEDELPLDITLVTDATATPPTAQEDRW